MAMCNATATAGRAQQSCNPTPLRNIGVTCKSPVGDISAVTLIRTDTTLDHSQKAEKVWQVLCFYAVFCPLVWTKSQYDHGCTIIVMLHFQHSFSIHDNPPCFFILHLHYSMFPFCFFMIFTIPSSLVFVYLQPPPFILHSSLHVLLVILALFLIICQLPHIDATSALLSLQCLSTSICPYVSLSSILIILHVQSPIEIGPVVFLCCFELSKEQPPTSNHQPPATSDQLFFCWLSSLFVQIVHMLQHLSLCISQHKSNKFGPACLENALY